MPTRIARKAMLGMLTAAHIAGPQWVAAAETALPCPTFTAGSTWDFTMSDEYGTGRMSMVVLSRAGKAIILGSKSVLTMKIPGMPNASPQKVSSSSEIRLEESGSLVVQESVGDNRLSIFYNPGQPFCGKVPDSISLEQKTSADPRGVSARVIWSARSQGAERVTVPAGSFDTTVVEIREEIISAGAPTPGVTTVRRVYAAAGVGIVRQVMTRPSFGADTVSAPDSRTAALMQQAMAKMQRGEDTTALMKQLAELQNSQATARPATTQSIMELQSYRIAKERGLSTTLRTVVWSARRPSRHRHYRCSWALSSTSCPGDLCGDRGSLQRGGIGVCCREYSSRLEWLGP